MEDETTYYGNPVQFSRDWADRLRKAKALDDLSDNPIMSADDRYVKDIGDTLQEAQRQYSSADFGFRPSDTVTDRLANLFSDRQSYLKGLGGDEVKSFGERLQDFERRTGASFSNLSGQDFGGIRHETISHLLPYDKGFSADYSDKMIRGQRIGASPISPLNERLATWNDTQLDLPSARFTFNRLFADDDTLNQLYDAQGEYAAGLKDVGRAYTKSELRDLTPDQRSRLRLFEATSNNTNPFLFPTGDNPNRMRPFFPSGSNITPVEAQTVLNLNEAQRLYEMKFTEPLRRRFNNLGLVQAPPEVSRDFHIPLGRGLTDKNSLLSGLGGRELREFRGLSVEETPYTRLQNLSKNLQTLGSGRFGRSGADMLLFARDPVTASLEGARGLVKENPRGALLGSAASLADPEVAKAVARDDYGAAAATVGRDVAIGAATEALLKQAAKRAPAAAAVLNSPAARLAGPVATGVALFTQGSPGSLTDVITRKAAQNPVSFLPSVKPNPSTDVGARAGRFLSNQGWYIINQLRAGRLPYFGGR